jgi:hypothetical protein
MQIIKKKTIELKFHPFWNRIHKNLPPEYPKMKEDMLQRGQQQIVEILPDDTIITGHLRVLICLELGIEEVLCVVRTDLDTEEKQLQHMIKDNTLRRQLSAVEIAELAEIMEQMGNDCPPGRKRDWIGAEFGFSGRKLADIQRSVKDAKESNNIDALQRLSTSSTCASKIIQEQKEEDKKMLRIGDLKQMLGRSTQKRLDSYDRDPPEESPGFVAEDNIDVIPKNKQAEEILRCYKAEEIKVSLMDFLSSPGITADQNKSRRIRKILSIFPKATFRLLKDNNLCIESDDWFFRV